MSTPVTVGPALGLALALVVAVAAGVCWLGRLGHARGVLVAGARAVVQLGAVAAVLAALVTSLPASLLFVLFMHSIATATASRRLVGSARGWACALPIGAGPLLVVTLLVLLQVIPLEGVAVVPFAGILIGGSMAATVLAGRRGLDDLAARRGEVEAALALGFEQRAACLMVSRPAASEALVPALDQTRTVGLVALPGTFVGTLLGGASPVEAGAVQVLVLVALLAIQAVAVVATVELIARGRLRRPV